MADAFGERPPEEEMSRLEQRMDMFYEALQIVEALTEPLPKLQEEMAEIGIHMGEVQGSGSVRQLENLLLRQADLLQRNPHPPPRFDAGQQRFPDLRRLGPNIRPVSPPPPPSTPAIRAGIHAGDTTAAEDGLNTGEGG
ncbi:hypothetical protein L484_014316 [Morus notabilis]|uniref:Uncharacterized protein n=1 Tax=Morus notabilis TaxID=981085 RepID=W9RK36_9ROSA|nr:hypothetical protein L484_014316 [Morus notabilis]